MATQTFKIKPKSSSVKVLDPQTLKPLKSVGETKPRNEYWLRRLMDGDVVEVIKQTTEGK